MPISIQAVDLFCGAGGLSFGLKQAGLQVLAGVDVDQACEFAYSENNRAVFIKKSVEEISGAELKSLFSPNVYSLLAGCAPCQPFSKYRQGKQNSSDGRWNLLSSFRRLAKEIDATFVTMENVPRLAKQGVFLDFKSSLEDCGYYTWCEVVNCSNYGVPQDRQRLVLVASKLGKISLSPSNHGKPLSVKDVLAKLPSISAGDADHRDPMHTSAGLTPLNLKRIQASVPGGTWRDWPEDLIADCHRKKSGKSYPSVYGRMKWDAPSPTITTQFYGFGNGRFGHPAQDRGISLREGAMLQSFPREYKFVKPGNPIEFTSVGRLIGNAVPVNLAAAIGKCFVDHAKSYAEKNVTSENKE